MLIGGIIGRILFDIPLVVICVIIASLIESFLILPGHLHHTFRNARAARTSGFRRRFDEGFERFRNGTFLRLVTAAVRRPMTTLSVAVAALLLTAGLIAGGRLAFTFFPHPGGADPVRRGQLRSGYAARAGGAVHRPPGGQPP